MARFEDLTGRTFDRLYVDGYDYKRVTPGGTIKRYWKCTCVCGNTTSVEARLLRSGNTGSCGCKHKEMLVQKNVASGRWSQHEKINKRLYYIWNGMNARCYSPKTLSYKNYGARGIQICEEWRNSFLAFQEWALSHGYKERLSIERKNNDGNYCPENCTFATKKEQCNNTRRSRRVHAFGETKTLAQWSDDKRCKAPASLIGVRIEKGWNKERAITEPPKPFNHKKERIIKAFGESKRVCEWVEDVRCSVSYQTVKDRLNKLGWAPEKAISTPKLRHRA